MEFSPYAFNIVRQIAAGEVANRALMLAMRGAVTTLNREPFPGGFAVGGEVADGEYCDYVTAEIMDAGEISFLCSCGEAAACEHLCALLILELRPSELALDDLSQGGSRQGGLQQAWRQELDAVLPQHNPRALDEACIFFTLAEGRYRSGSRPVPEVQIRLGERGKRGQWIKGSARWHAVASRDALDLTAHDLLVRLTRLVDASVQYSYWGAADQELIPLSRLPGAEAWELLQRLHGAGVPMISLAKRQRRVEFSQVQAEVVGQVQHREEGLRFAAETQIGGERIEDRALYAVGDPAVAIADVSEPGHAEEQFVLHPLRTAMTAMSRRLLQRPEPILVPDSEREAFMNEYLPRIQAVMPIDSPDGSVRIPAPPVVRARLGVVHEGKRVQLDWSWDAPPGLARDPAREREVLGQIQAASGAYPDLLWPELDSGPKTIEQALPEARGIPEPLALPKPSALSEAASLVFVTQVLPALREAEGLIITESEGAPEYREADTFPVVSVSTEATDELGDWFDLHVTVSVDGEPVEFADIYAALARGDAYFALPSGTYFSLENEEFDRLRQILAEARALGDRPSHREESSGALRINRYQLDLWDELSQLGLVAAQEAQWWLAVQSLGEQQRVEPVAVPLGIHADLRDYQREGLAWLHFLRTSGLGGLLADEMGLGKTLQTIAMMEFAREENPHMPPFLVVAPTSVVGNWARECARFAPGLRVRTISAMASKRGATLRDATAGAHVVVTSYALFRGEAEEYRALEWSGLILDEAQQIKNHASHGYRAARALAAPFTLVITGTPLENNLLELWALVSLAAPGLLGNRQRFTEFYRTPIERERDAERLALLQRRIRPFLLRRSKSLVAAELPPKQEQTIEVSLHAKHRKLYDVQFQRERQRLLGLIDDVNANRFEIFQSLTLLRQLALDPALVDAGTAPSAKLDALVELLTEASEEGHRVLVLSQFTRFLRSARERADAEGLASCYLDGSTKDRQRVIDEFRGGDAPVFFVSLKAGGAGLNLVEADYVVLLDPWWNPAVEAQAIDRTHRIGQHRPVFVYRMVAANTIEQKVIALRESKAELFAKVLDGEGVGGGATLSAQEIRDLLE